jgi:hypothetical protein
MTLKNVTRCAVLQDLGLVLVLGDKVGGTLLSIIEGLADDLPALYASLHLGVRHSRPHRGRKS